MRKISDHLKYMLPLFMILGQLFSLISCTPGTDNNPLLLLLSSQIKYPRLQKIHIDGFPFDWPLINALAEESGQTAAAVKAAHDSEYLYFIITGSGLGPNYDLLIDTDSNQATGHLSGHWTSSGCDYLVQNGFLHKSTGPGWDWQNLGTADISHSVNSEVIEIRIKKTAIADISMHIRAGFRDVDGSWAVKSTLPAGGALPSYDQGAGYNLTDAGTAMRIMVPAYFESSVLWNWMTRNAVSMPDQIFAIANPDDGPGSAATSHYTAMINSMRAGRGRVLGYVSTGYGNRDINMVKSDVDSWFSFYSIDGIFLDEQPNTAGKETYYRELYTYIKSKKSSGLVVANPGISTIESYLVNAGDRVSDILCIYETSGDFTAWSPPSWTQSYHSDNFYVLPLGAQYGKSHGYIDHAKENNATWVYITSDDLPNPWDTLSGYFDDQCGYTMNR